jgi:acetyl/propionyl-CoA carboxylase alpha subunit
VFGDGQGGGVHLYERECSLQRRHQKVWEEAPAPNLPETTRQGLLTAAMNLVRQVRYRSAGTLEFLVDDHGGFYFLEMNTRLQVEHPVTEQVTGVDLVTAMLELAMGRTSLKEVGVPRGHAIEVRLYAEDPSQDFRPTPGKVSRLKWPTGTGIRVESGIEEGQTVGTSFDSMLAKLIVHAPTRSQAIERMKFALDETVILGMGCNQSYLRSLCDHPAVLSGKVDTDFLGREFAKFAPKPDETQVAWLMEARRKGWTRGAVTAASGGTQKGWPSAWEHFSGGGR